MHQPLTEPRPSLYYQYKTWPAWLPSRGGRQSRKQVVIVGAGPAGLVTALELARHGVPSVILEAECQVSEGSRAIVFTRRSLEILQQVGVADRLVSNSLPWTSGNSWYRGERVFRMETPHDEDDRFAPMNNIQQQFLEAFLVDACQAEPLIDLRWGNLVRVFNQNANSVRAEVDTPEGPYTIETDWLVAADGGRSPIRTALKLKLEGASYEGNFVIADIRVDLPLPTERQAYFDPEWNPGNTVLVHREPHGIWRIDYQLPADESPASALAPETLKQRIDAVLAMVGHPGLAWELDWSSVYAARALTLPDYVQGRILFVGDAAHLLPIFGVRGANTAFQDAQSLGWQLGQVARGLADRSLLANYSAERVGAAREIIEEAGKSTRFMTPPSAGYRQLRDAVLTLSLTEPFVRPLYHWRTSRPHAYRDSALNSPDDDDARFLAGPAAGEVALNVRLAEDDFLFDHLGQGFDLLWFGRAESLADRLPQPLEAVLANARQRGVPIRLIAIVAAGAAGARVSARPVVPGADLTLVDPEGRLRARYGVTPLDSVDNCHGDETRSDETSAEDNSASDARASAGAAYLLRPDQHICARWLELDAGRLEAALERALPRPGPGWQRATTSASSTTPASRLASSGSSAAPLSPGAASPGAASPASAAAQPASASGLALADLERVYDALAVALDAVAPEQREHFLVRLALLAAQTGGDAALTLDQIERAQPRR